MILVFQILFGIKYSLLIHVSYRTCPKHDFSSWLHGVGKTHDFREQAYFATSAFLLDYIHVSTSLQSHLYKYICVFLTLREK